MLVAGVSIVAGAVLLGVAGDRLVDFAAGLAAKLRLTPAVIGLTVVAAGTSMPELFVSLTANTGGAPAVAVGNVIGANVANLGLILGGAALLAPIPFPRAILRLEYPFLVLASVVVLLLCRDGAVDRLEGAAFVVAMVAFLTYCVWIARAEATAAERRELRELVPEEAAMLRPRPGWLLAAGIVLSLIGLGVGAHLLVGGAVVVAEALGISERVIGLTVVSIGTTTPELAASLAAAWKRHLDMAVTNVVGSYVINLLGVLGSAALVRPVPVDPRTVAVDMWVMLGFALLLAPLVLFDRRLGRRDGALLLAAWAAYVTWLVVGGG